MIPTNARRFQQEKAKAFFPRTRIAIGIVLIGSMVYSMVHACHTNIVAKKLIETSGHRHCNLSRGWIVQKLLQSPIWILGGSANLA